MDVAIAPTVEGTDAHAALISPGFNVTDEVDPDEDEGGGADKHPEEEEVGVDSAVVLSFAAPATLDPTVAQSILRTTYELSSDAGRTELAVVRFNDGLRLGQSSGVVNNITIAGTSHHPLHLIPLEIRRASGSSLFVGGDAKGDANADGNFDQSDSIYIAQYRFLHGPTPSAPFPDCGERDPEIDLECLLGEVPKCDS